jgi:hypothetical protein
MIVLLKDRLSCSVCVIPVLSYLDCSVIDRFFGLVFSASHNKKI